MISFSFPLDSESPEGLPVDLNDFERKRNRTFHWTNFHKAYSLKITTENTWYERRNNTFDGYWKY